MSSSIISLSSWRRVAFITDYTQKKDNKQMSEYKPVEVENKHE